MQHSIDATNKMVGRLSTEVAHILRGKNSAAFDPSKMGTDTVVVYNTDKIRISGKKSTQKTYYRHSGFPGGIRGEKFQDVLERDSRLLIKRAVMGMLPKNKLRAQMIKKLTLKKGEEK